MKIIKADKKYLSKCALILGESKLGQDYFINRAGEYNGEYLLKEGFEKNEIYVGINSDEECVGFSWIQDRGIFHWFPFLHIVAISKSYRGKGYGSSFMSHYENLASKNGANRIFLMVGSYNTKAIKLYKKLNYQEVGSVPELFVNGVDEILMMKIIEDK